MLKVQAFVPNKVCGFCQTSLPTWQLKILFRINIMFGTGTKFNTNEKRGIFRIKTLISRLKH